MTTDKGDDFTDPGNESGIALRIQQLIPFSRSAVSAQPQTHTQTQAVNGYSSHAHKQDYQYMPLGTIARVSTQKGQGMQGRLSSDGALGATAHP